MGFRWVSGGGEIPTPQKKPEGMSHSHPFHHASKTGFSDGSAGPEVYSASFVRSSWKQRPKDVERRRCHGGGGVTAVLEEFFFLLGTYGVVLVLGLGEYYFSNILQLLTYFLNRVIMQVGTFPPPPFVLEELELMTAQLFDGQQVQQAVQKALTSLEAAVVRWP